MPNSNCKLCPSLASHLSLYMQADAEYGIVPDSLRLLALMSFTDMITPTQMADRLIKFLEARNPKQKWLSDWSADDIRKQAAASTARYEAGKSLSVFDGVPFVVKDSINALPYQSWFGTKFMGKK